MRERWVPRGKSGEGETGIGLAETQVQNLAADSSQQVELISVPKLWLSCHVHAQGLRILGAAPLVGGVEATETPLTHLCFPQQPGQPIEFPSLVIGRSWSHAPS